MVGIHDNPQALIVLGVAITSVILSTLSFALRVWARSLAAFEFWYDDLLMSFAMVLNFHRPLAELHSTIARY